MSRVVLALGNPGRAAMTQKHNAGHIVLRQVVDRLQASGLELEARATPKGDAWKVTPEQWRAMATASWLPRDVRKYAEDLDYHTTYLVLSNSYMNLSGSVAASWVAKRCDNEWSRLMVVADELDLPKGALRLRGMKPSVPKELSHNGIKNIAVAARGSPFLRLRVGVDRGHPLRHLDKLDIHNMNEYAPRAATACMLFGSSASTDKLLTAVNAGAAAA